jgi:hypothetical protein
MAKINENEKDLILYWAGPGTGAAHGAHAACSAVLPAHDTCQVGSAARERGAEREGRGLRRAPAHRRRREDTDGFHVTFCIN